MLKIDKDKDRGYNLLRNFPPILNFLFDRSSFRLVIEIHHATGSPSPLPLVDHNHNYLPGMLAG